MPPPQATVIDFLSTPDAHGGAPVEVIETHASVVFLAGSRALKLKRAVTYDYLDFSTPERRRAMCEAELRLNRRLAPALYRRVVPVTREADGSLALGGRGEPVEWVLEMARFDQAGLFDRLAASGALDLALMGPLASAIAAFHASAATRADHGGRSALARVIEGNASGLREFGGGALDAARCARLAAESEAALDRVGDLLDRRRDTGCVRECHGDLHLRNIVLLDGRPTPFDGIEFNDDFSCIDVMYDLAFLLMDLWRRELPAHANAVWNGYLAETGDDEAVSLMPLFLSCRAAVRAKTSVTAASLQTKAEARDRLHGLARTYLEMALRLLRPAPPCLVAVGGLSGTGKSTLARALAPSIGAVPGAVVLRSDAIRKRLHGVPELARLGPDGYTAAMSRQVYETMTSRARAIVGGGHAVIADAVFSRPDDRLAIERAAGSAAFVGLWLDAPDATLVSRVEARSQDASDADAGVIRLQQAEETGPVTWHRIDASGPLDLVRRQADAAITSVTP